MATTGYSFDALVKQMQSVGSLPVGFTGYWDNEVPPQGWLECNGAEIFESALPDLFALYVGKKIAGRAFVPDHRGEFLRGWDNGRGIDAGRELGSSQGESFKSHNHVLTLPPSAYNGGVIGGTYFSSDGYKTGGTRSGTTTEVGGDETRPRNNAVMVIIKAYDVITDPAQYHAEQALQDIKDNGIAIELLKTSAEHNGIAIELLKTSALSVYFSNANGTVVGFENGLTIQYGTVDAKASYQHYTLPTAFSDTNYKVFCYINRNSLPNGERNGSYYAVSETTFSMQNGAGTQVPTDWLAIGHIDR